MSIDPFIGRRVSVGFGFEGGTPGTEVAPGFWTKQLLLDFQRMVTPIQNVSAMGRVEKVNDSAIALRFAQGKLDGKVFDQSTGYLLTNIFGLVATTTNADASGTVKDHTFDTSQGSVAPTLTIVRKDPLTNRRHGLGTLDDIEISCTHGDWVKFTSTINAKPGITGTDTPAYVTENDFFSKHVTTKLATNVAGLGAAATLANESFKLKITRKSTPFAPLGTDTPTAFNTDTWEASGEVVLRYTETTYEDLWYANTPQAMQIAIANTDVIIGTSANPTLKFTAPRARLTTFTQSTDLDKIIRQTIGFYCELDATAAYSLRAVLTNLKTNYTS